MLLPQLLYIVEPARIWEICFPNITTIRAMLRLLSISRCLYSEIGRISIAILLNIVHCHISGSFDAFTGYRRSFCQNLILNTSSNIYCKFKRILVCNSLLEKLWLYFYIQHGRDKNVRDCGL